MKLSTSITFFISIIVFSLQVKGQEVVFTRHENSILFGKNFTEVKADNQEGIFSCDGVNIQYTKQWNSGNAEVNTKELKKYAIPNLKIHKKYPLSPIYSKIKNNNFEVFIVSSLKSKTRNLYKLVFDNKLNLVSSEILFDVGRTFQNAFYTKIVLSENKESILIARFVIAPKSKFHIIYQILSTEGILEYENVINFESPFTDYVARSPESHREVTPTIKNIIASITLLDDKSVAFNDVKNVYLHDVINNKTVTILSELKTDFYGFMFKKGNDGKNYCFAGFNRGLEMSLAAIEVSSDYRTIIDSEMFDIEGFYNKKFDYPYYVSIIRPRILNVEIDSKGTATVVLTGDAFNNYSEFLYSVDMAIVRCSQFVLKEHIIIPYIHAFQSELFPPHVIIKENTASIIFKDIKDNYPNGKKFEQTTKTNYLFLEMDYALFQHNFETNASLREKLQYSMPKGTEYVYSDKRTTTLITDIEMTNGRYLVQFYKYRVQGIDTFFGSLIIK